MKRFWPNRNLDIVQALRFGAVLLPLIASTAGAGEPADRAGETACETECEIEVVAKECPQCQAAQSDDVAAEQGGTMATLLQLRSLFGDPLAGTSLEDCGGDEGFLNALSHLTSNEEAQRRCAPSRCGRVTEQVATPVPDERLPLPRAVYENSVIRAPQLPAPHPAPAVPRPEYLPPHSLPFGFHVSTAPGCPVLARRALHVYAAAPAHHHPEFQALRQSARELETVASDLEDLGKFEAADELRAVVARLRKEARGTADVPAEAAVTADGRTTY